MKTHKARWQQSAPGVWILKAPTQDGGAVLATITTKHFFRHEWSLSDGCNGVASSRSAAQRACRRALREAIHDN